MASPARQFASSLFPPPGPAEGKEMRQIWGDGIFCSQICLITFPCATPSGRESDEANLEKRHLLIPFVSLLVATFCIGNMIPVFPRFSSLSSFLFSGQLDMLAFRLVICLSAFETPKSSLINYSVLSCSPGNSHVTFAYLSVIDLMDHDTVLWMHRWWGGAWKSCWGHGAPRNGTTDVLGSSAGSP